MKNLIKMICIISAFLLLATGSAKNATEKVKDTPRIDYSPSEYISDICVNCESHIEGLAYMPSEEFMQFVIDTYDREYLVVCEDCAREMYQEELDAGASLDDFLAK